MHALGSRCHEVKWLHAAKKKNDSPGKHCCKICNATFFRAISLGCFSGKTQLGNSTSRRLHELASLPHMSDITISGERSQVFQRVAFRAMISASYPSSRRPLFGIIP